MKINRRRFMNLSGCVLGTAMTGMYHNAFAHSVNKVSYGYTRCNPHMIITPHDTLYESKYNNYIVALKEISHHRMTVYGLINSVIIYTSNRYPHNLAGVTNEQWINNLNNEIMGRIDDGVARCNEMATLCQYGLHELGLRSRLIWLYFNSSDGYLQHANLELELDRVTYVAECTGGFMMEKKAYDEYITKLLGITWMIAREQVITGLE